MDTPFPESSMPIGVFVQEAYNTALFAADDRLLFESKGFDWRIVDELFQRIELLRKYEALWWQERFGEPAWKREYEECRVRAAKARVEIAKDLKFAFPRDENVARVLKKIKQGSGEIDDIEDTSILHAMAVDYAQGLAAINSRPGLVAELLQCAQQLALFKPQHDFNKGLSLAQRQRAYILCAAGLEALRRCARYALWDNKARLKGYASEYFRKSARNRAAQRPPQDNVESGR
jgi:hypothetical protein